MNTLTNAAERAAVKFYDQSRSNGSYHELALRIATAAWRKSYPEATADEAEHAVKRAVQGAQTSPTGATNDIEPPSAEVPPASLGRVSSRGGRSGAIRTIHHTAREQATHASDEKT